MVQLSEFRLESPTFDAARRLKNTEDWQIIMDGLRNQTVRLMHDAIALATPESCGYARGVRDVLNSFEIIESNDPVARGSRGQQPAISPRRPKD